MGGNGPTFVCMSDRDRPKPLPARPPARSAQHTPRAAEASDARGFKFFLERFETPKSAFEIVAQLSRGRPSGARRHQSPEHGVVRVAAAIVADCSADVVRNGAQVADQLLNAFLLEVRLAGNRLVDVIHIGFVMASVMDFHCLGVNVRFKGFFRIRELR